MVSLDVFYVLNIGVKTEPDKHPFIRGNSIWYFLLNGTFPRSNGTDTFWTEHRYNGSRHHLNCRSMHSHHFRYICLPFSLLQGSKSAPLELQTFKLLSYFTVICINSTDSPQINSELSLAAMTAPGNPQWQKNVFSEHFLCCGTY